MKEKKPQENKTTNLSKKEKAWTIVGLVIGAIGIALATISIIGDYLGANNPLKKAQTAVANFLNISFSWRVWGIIFIALAVIILMLTFYFGAKKADKDNLKTNRNTDRVAINLNAVEEAVVEEPAPAPVAEPAAEPEEAK